MASCYSASIVTPLSLYYPIVEACQSDWGRSFLQPFLNDSLFAINCSLWNVMRLNWWWHRSILVTIFVGFLSSSSSIITGLRPWVLLLLTPWVSKGVLTGWHQRRSSTSDYNLSGSASSGWWSISYPSPSLSDTICAGSEIMGSYHSFLWLISAIAQKA